MKLKDIAELIEGRTAGDPETEIKGVSGIADAREGDITFLADKRYVKKLAGSKASCVIVKELLPDLDMAQVEVQDPQYAFVRLLERFYTKPALEAGISPLSFVSKTAQIAADASVYAFSFISDKAEVGARSVIHAGAFIGEGSRVGDDCIIYPNVVIREGVSLGSRVIVHAGTVIGSDGFGYIFREGRHIKIPQVGGVIVEDDVEIGANATIDRATTGNTVIGEGSKIDNLVQIAHNVKIGAGSIIVAQTGIAGSTEIGRFVTLGGQVGVADHATIEDGVMVGSQSGVMGHLAKGVYSGSPVIPHIQWLKSVSLFARLPELSKKLKLIEDKVEEIQRRLKNDGH